MTLIIDDLLELPIKFAEVILNIIAQTAFKAAWADYRRRLNVALIRLKREYEEGRISKKRVREIESKIYHEMRLANRVLGSEG